MHQEVIIVIASVLLILFFFMGIMFLLALVNFNNKKQILLDNARRIESAYREEVLKSKVEIQEETFRNISQEIHDNIGQSLSLLKLILFTIDKDNFVQIAQSIDSCKQLVSSSIFDLRNLAHSLNPDFIQNIGLSEAIKQQLNQLRKTNLYSTSFEVIGEPEKRNPQKELILLRVVQELLNNIIKHAHASKVDVLMVYENHSLKISVTDNGKGFEMADSQIIKGMGLSSMQNRVTLIGGVMTISSSLGNGTCALIEVK